MIDRMHRINRATGAFILSILYIPVKFRMNSDFMQDIGLIFAIYVFFAVKKYSLV